MSLIPTTHVGSLPRPKALSAMLLAQEDGERIDPGAFERELSAAVHDVVARQVRAGIDIVSDGEMSKIAYAVYPKERLSGFGGQSKPRGAGPEVSDFPEWAKTRRQVMSKRPVCQGPVAVKDDAALRADLRHFREAVDAAKPAGAFLTAASPGLIAYFMQDEYYHDHEKYLAAVAEAMRAEYEAIVAAGFDLQLDCPDLALSRHLGYASDSDDEWKKKCELAIEALNAATQNISPDRMRLHVCWGNYEGPHHYDVPLAQVLPTVFKARPAAISFEGANPRHEHEWEVFQTLRLPDEKKILPGVVDSTTNFIEHPRLIAQRIERYANVVGKERVVAGVDCGFATTAEFSLIDPAIVWAKLEALAQGARIASERLWAR
ncbi:MAG TPA: cobalamin-independent methionine synthase II family protein [Candidatus Binatia bacterium]|nr:cobalamin-independent methionine synthase II family protein [Candidatus Binatia bacterium]